MEAFGGVADLGFDDNNAHVQPDGSYHYHGTPVGLLAGLGHDADLVHVGFAADGHLIAHSPSDRYAPSYRLDTTPRTGSSCLVSLPGSATYSASKAAAWALSNGLRQELRAQGTQVTSLHVGYMDTDMVRGVAGPKASPADVARQALQGLAAGDFEVLADDISRQVKQSLSTARPAYAG